MKSQFQTSSQRKLQSARISLLLIVILSIVNLFSIFFAETYFYFSSYLAQLFAEIGYFSYLETGESLLMIIMGVVAVISLVPYILSWIFSKKHVAWMIVALVFISLDTLLMLFYVPAYLEIGDFTIIINLIFHVAMIVEFALGVKAHFDIKREKAEAEYLAEQYTVEVTESEATADSAPEATRSITVKRKKAFAAMAMAMKIYVNDTVVATLKCGESATFDAPTAAFRLGAATGVCSGELTVPAGEYTASFEAVVKMGLTIGKVEIKEV